MLTGPVLTGPVLTGKAFQFGQANRVLVMPLGMHLIRVRPNRISSFAVMKTGIGR